MPRTPEHDARKQRVLIFLRQHRPNWVTTAMLESVGVGASEGTRRFRELRAEGYPVECRRMVGSTQWEYRLKPASDLRRIERDGKPDQYLNERLAASQSADGRRKAEAEAEVARLRSLPRVTFLRLGFGERLCRSCGGNGGTQYEACFYCAGTGKDPR